MNQQKEGRVEPGKSEVLSCTLRLLADVCPSFIFTKYEVRSSWHSRLTYSECPAGDTMCGPLKKLRNFTTSFFDSDPGRDLSFGIHPDPSIGQAALAEKTRPGTRPHRPSIHAFDHHSSIGRGVNQRPRLVLSGLHTHSWRSALAPRTC